MLSHGAGLALCVALALSEVKRGWGGGVRGGGQRSAGRLRAAPPPPPPHRVPLAFSPQAALGEAAGCSANLTEQRVAGQGAWLRWRARGAACNFSLSGHSEDGLPAACLPARSSDGSYGCSLQGLEAGTWYHLRIQPLAGGEHTAVSLQTGRARGRGWR